MQSFPKCHFFSNFFKCNRTKGFYTDDEFMLGEHWIFDESGFYVDLRDTRVRVSRKPAEGFVTVCTAQHGHYGGGV